MRLPLLAKTHDMTWRQSCTNKSCPQVGRIIINTHLRFREHLTIITVFILYHIPTRLSIYFSEHPSRFDNCLHFGNLLNFTFPISLICHLSFINI